MRKIFFVFLTAVLFSVLYTACDTIDLTPAPEVEVYWFDPLGWYATPLDTFAEISQIDFRVKNYVDAIIREMAVDYRSVSSGDIVASNYTAGFGILLSGGNEGCTESCITSVVNWSLDISDAVAYMFANNDNTVAEITFRGEDAFGNEREFECVMYFSIIQMPEGMEAAAKEIIDPVGK
jgi:hypothetical protein